MLYWLNGQQCFEFIVLLNCFRFIERHLIGFYDRFNCLELKTKKNPGKKLNEFSWKSDFIDAVWNYSEVIL